MIAIRPVSMDSIAALRNAAAARADDRFEVNRHEGLVALAFRTGSVDDIRAVEGLIDTDSLPVALRILSARNADVRYHPDNEGSPICAAVAPEFFRHFGMRIGSPWS